jgi:hypothetical protein
MPRGGRVAVRKQRVNRLCQASAADFISVAGHSLWLYQTSIEGQMFQWRHGPRETVAPASAMPEKLFCTLISV